MEQQPQEKLRLPKWVIYQIQGKVDSRSQNATCPWKGERQKLGMSLLWFLISKNCLVKFLCVGNMVS